MDELYKQYGQLMIEHEIIQAQISGLDIVKEAINIQARINAVKEQIVKELNGQANNNQTSE